MANEIRDVAGCSFCVAQCWSEKVDGVWTVRGAQIVACVVCERPVCTGRTGCATVVHAPDGPSAWMCPDCLSQHRLTPGAAPPLG